MARRHFTVTALVLLAALVAGGWQGCRSEGSRPGARLLDYVPADTIFFAGLTQAGLARELGGGVYRYLVGLAGEDPRQAARDAGPAAGVLVALLQAQKTAIERGRWAFAAQGMPRAGVMAAYTVGQTPVLRWQLVDADAFWRELGAAERAAGVRARDRSRGPLRFRRYPFELGFEHGKRPMALILATGDGFAVAALHAARDTAAEGEEDATLDEVLGLDKPSDALSRVALDNLARAYGLIPGTVAFIDNGRLLGPLTEPSVGLVERIGGLIEASDTELYPWLRALGLPACREAVALLPDYWSRTVMGVVDFDPQDRRLSQRLVFESDQQRGLAWIDSLQGQIPALVGAPETLLGLGIGLDFTQLLSPPAEEEPEDVAPEEESGDGESGDGALAAEESAEESKGAGSPDAAGVVSDCPIIAAVQRGLAGAAGATGGADSVEIGSVHPLAQVLPAIEGVGASVFRTPAAAGRGRQPGAASALMVATEQPAVVRNALRTVFALQAHGRPPIDQPFDRPWRAAWHTTELDPMREQGLLLSSSKLMLAQPDPASEEALTPNRLLALRYHHGVSARVIAAAVAPWLKPLPAAQRHRVQETLRGLQRLPFDLTLDLRVGERGIELNVAVAPALIPAPPPVAAAEP